ncbi:MAG: pantoate--beta-alanine ligase [Candidatus Rifleibacteriota bacterium]
MTRVIRNANEWRLIRKDLIADDIGFVPTMGALHEGHLSLLQKCRQQNALTVASVFVNPPQFNDPEDLERYPRDFASDLKILRDQEVDFVFHPDYGEIYADDYRFRVCETEFSKELCGKNRAGHFEAVLTVVMKLFNIIKPGRAYFGEKDYQQYLLVKDMVKNFFMNISIVPCPIIREPDGLARSSRNQLLSPEERAMAPLFYKTLSSGKSIEEIKKELINHHFKIDYIEDHFDRLFGAVILGKTRLIDNVPRK